MAKYVYSIILEWDDDFIPEDDHIAKALQFAKTEAVINLQDEGEYDDEFSFRVEEHQECKPEIQLTKDNSKISREDVFIVANMLKIKLTEEEAQAVLQEVKAQISSRTTLDTWDIITEDIIYTIRNTRQRYVLKASKLLDWFFNSENDIDAFGADCAKQLMAKGKIEYTPKDILDQLGYLPLCICEGIAEDNEEEINSYENVTLINDIKTDEKNGL